MIDSGCNLATAVLSLDLSAHRLTYTRETYMKKKRAELIIRPRPSDATEQALRGHLDPDCHHWEGVLVDATRCRDNYDNLALDRNIEDAPTMSQRCCQGACEVCSRTPQGDTRTTAR